METKPALVRVKRRRQDPAPEDLGTISILCLPNAASEELEADPYCSPGVFGRGTSFRIRPCQRFGRFSTLSSS